MRSTVPYEDLAFPFESKRYYPTFVISGQDSHVTPLGVHYTYDCHLRNGRKETNQESINEWECSESSSPRLCWTLHHYSLLTFSPTK
jgi:hypothetical protein